MKKRSLSLFLALLMVFGSVLPVFNLEVVAEEPTPSEKAATFYSLYVDGATLNWMAYYEEAGEIANSANLKTENGAVLSVTPNAGGSAIYGDGYLRLIDGQLK